MAYFRWFGGPHHCVVVEPEEPAAGGLAASLADDLASTLELVLDAAVEDVSAKLPARLDVTLTDDGGLLFLGEGLQEGGVCAETVVAAAPLWAHFDVESARCAGIRVRPAPAVFGAAPVDTARLMRRAQELAVLHPHLVLRVLDEPGDRARTFSYPGGLVDYVAFINRTKTAIQPDIVHFRRTLLGTTVEIALQWNAGYSESVYAFVNFAAADAQIEGLRTGVASALSRYAKRHRLLRGTEPELRVDDASEGLAAVLAVTSTQPAAELNLLVELVFGDYLLNWLEEHPNSAKAIVKKAISSADAARSPRRSYCGMA